MKQYLPDPDLAGDTRFLKIKNNAAVKDLFKDLGIPLDTPKVIMLNDRQGTLEDALKTGDRVTVFPPVGGG